MSTSKNTLLVSLVAAAVALGLAGCGKKGAPSAPGPGDQVTYPHSYPTP